VTELENEILRKASHGDRKAFRLMYDFYAPFIWKVIFRTVNGNTEIATEVMQNTFIKVHTSMKKFAFDSAFSTWLYRIAYNAALTVISKRRAEHGRFAEYQENVAGKERSDRYDDQERVRSILEFLSPDERFLLTLREVTGLSFDELSAITGKTEGSLRVAVHRIKERIRQEFGYEYAA
jgi:RNA polymerase sigma-70 factor, ECF subfamily